MDIEGYDYGGLDFVLHEPGLIEDTRMDEQAAQSPTDDIGAPIRQALQAFEATRTADAPAVACLIRVEGSDADEALGRQLLDRFAGTLRQTDRCLRDDHGDYVLAFADCDMDLARKRVGLMMRLAELSSRGASLWAGMAPVQAAGASLASVRTARVACELASYQPSGHIESVEL